MYILIARPALDINVGATSLNLQYSSRQSN